jgi:type IV pilus assembly protein PilC
MAIFNYKILDKKEEIIVGVVEAPNADLAVEALTEKGFKVVDLKEARASLNLNFKGLSFLNRINPKELVIFSRQLSVMISATVPIVQALKVIVKQTKSITFQDIIDQVADDVDEGLKFSEALKKHSVFSGFFVNMIASGESSGRLDEVLEYLADEVEKNYDLQSKIKGAMIYPTFIVGGLIVVGVAMMIFVIPQLTGMLTASGQELPFTTKALVFLSDLFRNYFVYLLLTTIIIGGGLFYFIKKTEAGIKLYNLLKLKAPVFGKLWQMIYLVRFAGTLSSLINAGVSLTNALNITADVVDNYYYKELIEEAVEKVKDGYSVAHVFSKSKMFPSMLSQMLKIGERTGRLGDVLDKLAGFYSREVENMVSNLTSLLEPMIMVVIGVAVGGMVAAIIMPMYNMANAF